MPEPPPTAAHDPATLDAAAELGLVADLADAGVYARTVGRFRENRIAQPTFAPLADPSPAPAAAHAALAVVDPHEPHAANLWRVHWFNRLDGTGPAAVPEHIELPPALTGVEARIVLAFGNRFPVIRAHKVLAAYACLVPRIGNGRFDPTWNRARRPPPSSTTSPTTGCPWCAPCSRPAARPSSSTRPPSTRPTTSPAPTPPSPPTTPAPLASAGSSTRCAPDPPWCAVRCSSRTPVRTAPEERATH